MAITAGSGTTIGTDDCAGVHIQKVKLVDGTADSTTAIPGGSSGLYTRAVATTATITTQTPAGSNVTLLSSAAGRMGATIYNDGAADLYVKFGTTASSTDFTVKISPWGYYEVPGIYTGRIDGIAASGTVRITELT